MKWLLLGTLGGIGLFFVVNEIYKAKNESDYQATIGDKHWDRLPVLTPYRGDFPPSGKEYTNDPAKSGTIF